VREVERLQQDKKHERAEFVACLQQRSRGARDAQRRRWHRPQLQRATAYGHATRNRGERRGDYDAIDYRRMKPALERYATTLGRKPKQIVADGDYTNHASVRAAADQGVDFYGSWQNSWRAANRRHDEMLAHSPWFRLWNRYGVCCRSESPVLSLAILRPNKVPHRPRWCICPL
jgi:hypothetical protein